MPALQDLMNAFRCMPHGKVCGRTHIPTEAFSCAAMQAAQMFYPVLMSIDFLVVEPSKIIFLI